MVDGRLAKPEEEIFPHLATMPMGFSWAMLAAQSILEHQLSEGGLCEERRMVDGRTVPSLRSGCVHVGYVDKVVVIGQDAEQVGKELRKAIDCLEAVGLRPHEVEQPCRRLEALGVLPDGERGEVRLAVRRRWKLYFGLHELLRRGVASGRDLQKVLGHLCFAFLLRRGLLSCLSSSFAFVERTGGKRVSIWASVRRELNMAAGLLPFCYAKVGAPLSAFALASDACMCGLAVSERCVGEGAAGAMGRQVEHAAAAGSAAPAARPS